MNIEETIFYGSSGNLFDIINFGKILMKTVINRIFNMGLPRRSAPRKDK